MEQRPRQAVAVFLTLVGFQEVSVGASHEHTAEAVVAVRLGKALLYLHDLRTAQQFAQAWQALGKEAKALPREIHPSLVAPLNGASEAAVLVDTCSGLSMAGRLVMEPKSHAQLHVSWGRVLFDIRDLGAYSSVTAAFRQAADLAETVFALGQRLVPSHEAAARQASALLRPSPGVLRVTPPRSSSRTASGLPARPIARYGRDRT
jgi:hypothetical protein